MIYLSLDADDFGRRIEKLLIEGNESQIKSLSENLEKTIMKIGEYLKKENFELLISAGDNILAKGNEIKIQPLLDYLLEISPAQTFSLGIADNLKSVFIALRYAKSIGKGILIKINEKEEIETIKNIS